MDPPLHHSSFPPSFFPTTTVTSTTAAGDLNNLPHVSTVPPSSIMGTTFNHPPYAEMIYAAITALKDPEGSSKRAIAKYIETAYSGLPPAHPALLTHHLKRLKNNGLLLMVKKSYKLPRSDNDATSNTVSDVIGPVPHQNFVNEPSIGVKRGRGRPPKPKPVPIAAVPVDTVASDEGHGNHGPGVAVDQQVMVGADGQQDQIVVKRGRGRPKKIGGLGLGHGHGHVIGGQVGGLAVKRGRGRPPKSVGRPKKPKSVTSIGGIKRRPGRPRKYPQPPLSVPYGPSSLPLAPQPGVAVPGADAPVVNGDTAPVNYAPRPRGRPRKNAAPVSTVGTMVSLPQKRPGRPPGSTGRPVGRPRKYQIGEPKQQAEAYKDLCRKLEFFQSRLMNAVGVIKPHVTNVSAIEAIVALQEMEGLASMDIRVPFRDESQPQPQPQSQQQPQPQPQPQPLHQHQHQFQLHPQPPPQPASQPQLQSQPSPQPQIQPPQSQPTPIQMTIPPFFQHS